MFSFWFWGWRRTHLLLLNLLAGLAYTTFLHKLDSHELLLCSQNVFIIGSSSSCCLLLLFLLTWVNLFGLCFYLFLDILFRDFVAFRQCDLLTRLYWRILLWERIFIIEFKKSSIWYRTISASVNEYHSMGHLWSFLFFPTSLNLYSTEKKFMVGRYLD